MAPGEHYVGATLAGHAARVERVTVKNGGRAEQSFLLARLPEEKRAAVDTLGMGLLDKLWLWFPEVFWAADADIIEWSDPDEPGLWSYWVNGYKAFGRPVLLGFNGGDQAHRVAEMTDEQAVDSAMSALRRMGT